MDGRRRLVGLLAGHAHTTSTASSRQFLGIGALNRYASSTTGNNMRAVWQQSGAWRRSISHLRPQPRRLPRSVQQTRSQSNVASPATASNIPLSAADAVALPPQRRHFVVRLLATFGLFCVFTPIGFYLAAGGPMTQTLREMDSIPTDAETLELVAPAPNDPAYEINQTILNHPLSKELFADPKFVASRPHLKIPPSLRLNSFTAGTLVGPDMMPVPALVFATKDGTELVQILYVGQALCGHPGLIHGGMLATLMDEALARCCFPGLPNKVGVTASLKIDYRTPCKAGQYIVLKCQTEKFEGRKAWVKGRIETLPVDGSAGALITEGEALFIEPRNAGMLSRQRKIVGQDE